MQTKNNIYCVIMAGGVGSRFWPMSTQKTPKQFHDALGVGKTLIQQTYDRLLEITTPDKIYVITGEEYTQLTLEQLPELSESQIIEEPTGMNTAPCALYSALKINQIDKEASIAVCPADHLILDTKTFTKKINLAIHSSKENGGLHTLGINPTRPDTGYGYIQFIEEEGEVKKVKTFTEKPELKMAQTFIESGDFLWNSGIFIWTAKDILSAFENHLPEMYHTFIEKVDALNTPEEKEAIRQVYPLLSKESIDTGVMEKAQNVYVIPSTFGWSDLGTWGSLYEQFEKDKNQNAVNGKWIKLYNATGNIVEVETEKAIIIDGLNDYIVIDTPQALLITPRDKDQDVKTYVNDLKLSKGDKFV